MKNSERSDQHYKARFQRLKRLFQRRTEPKPVRDWFATADEEGYVSIHPSEKSHAT